MGRADDGRRRELQTQIAVAREGMRQPPLNLRRATLATLRRVWRKTVNEARAKGLIRG